MTSDQLVVLRSYIHGWGLFAKSYFHRGQMVIEFTGEIINQTEANDREIMYDFSNFNNFNDG